MKEYEGQKLCPVCQIETAEIKYSGRGDSYFIDCPACSRIVLSSNLIEIEWDEWWSGTRRAALAHSLTHSRGVPVYLETGRPFLASSTLNEMKVNNIGSPSRLQQMENAIRYLGDTEVELGEFPAMLPEGAWAKIGSPSPRSAASLLEDMAATGHLSRNIKLHHSMGGVGVLNARLSLQGWQLWGRLKKGQTTSNDGFIAMQFGDARLDKLVSDIILSLIHI